MINWNEFFIASAETEALYKFVGGGGIDSFKKGIKRMEAMYQLKMVIRKLPAKEIRRRAKMAMQWRGYL